jgi:DNA-binding PadR family transcriptional regulator
MNLSADLLRGYTDSIILARLREGESYGYRINQAVNAISGGSFEMKEATLYTAFRRLESAGLIVSRWGDEATGARRRYYRLTEAGQNRLREDLAGWEDTKHLLDLLLKEDDHE